MCKRLLYIHDYRFSVDNSSKLKFEVGMPAQYFDRFTHAGYTVEVLSRVNRIESNEYFEFSSKIRSSPLSCFSYFKILFKIIVNKGYFCSFDIIVINFPSILSLLTIFFIPRGKSYVVEHVNDNNSFNQKFGGAIVGYFIRKVAPNLLSEASGVTVVAPYLISDFYPSNYLVSSNVIVNVPAFIDRDLSPKIRIVSVGALSKKKGFDLVISQLVTVTVPCIYIAYGPKNDVKIPENGSMLGRCVQFFYGGVVAHERVCKELSCADVFIQASRSEGLPRALLEAMAYSLPVVSSKLECFNDLVDSRLMIDWKRRGALDLALGRLLDPVFFAEQCQQNYCLAKRFDRASLLKKLTEFYTDIA